VVVVGAGLTGLYTSYELEKHAEQQAASRALRLKRGRNQMTGD
jgi:monoamine oxidase